MNFDFSNPTVIIATIAVVVLILVAVALAVHQSRKRTADFQRRFGPEYDLALREHGARSKAEANLLARVKRVERFKIRDLTAAERERYLSEWETVQSRFVDHPRGAVTEGDELVNSLMQARGFPTGDFNQRAADISVHHAHLVDSYRSANAIASRAGKNEATTEELRTAMIHYRALFDDLLGTSSRVDTRAIA
jgi:hypothetical protein